MSSKGDKTDVLLDVLIVDAGADLNVYMDSLPGRGEEAETDANKSGSCCAPNTTGGSPCCPAPGLEKDGSSGLDLAKMAADLADIDLNEWIGTLRNRRLASSGLR